MSLSDHYTTMPSDKPPSLAGKLWLVHWPLLLVAAAIAACGALTLYSVAGGSLDPWAERHILRFLVGTGLVLAIALMPIRLLLGLAAPVYLVALVMLCLVPLVGAEAYGAKRWLGAGGLSFQPSEPMKIGLMLMLARYYQWLPPGHASKPVSLVPPLALILLPVLLTLKQPDLGTAVLFAVLGFGMMFLGGVSPLYFLGGGAVAVAALPMVWERLHDYQRRRITVFLDPDQDPLGAGYHITQAKIALGSGGVSGKGFLHGTQSQLDFVPEKHTDFIFTMIAEEWGFVGGLLLLALYALLLIMLSTMALACRNVFCRLLIAGTGLMLFVYVFINIAMVAGLVPVVGVPLPLVSYGGTSMITVMIALGLAMSAWVHRNERLRREDLGMLW